MQRRVSEYYPIEAPPSHALCNFIGPRCYNFCLRVFFVNFTSLNHEIKLAVKIVISKLYQEIHPGRTKTTPQCSSQGFCEQGVVICAGEINLHGLGQWGEGDGVGVFEHPLNAFFSRWRKDGGAQRNPVGTGFAFTSIVATWLEGKEKFAPDLRCGSCDLPH